VSDFASTIAKIQDAAPNFICAALVGGAHISFFRQWAASGMNKKIPLTSTTFGVGNEHLALSAAEGDGILIAGNYSPELDTPANKNFLAAWAKRYGDAKVVHELAVSQYQGIMLWAEAVRKAGTVEREALIKTLETGLKIEGPAGTVAVDPKTHDASLDIKLMVVKDQKLTIIETAKQRPPADTAQYCDLLKNPDDNKQYEVKIRGGPPRSVGPSPKAQSFQVESIALWFSLVEHDLFGKLVSTFPDHALGEARQWTTRRSSFSRYCT
jgi:branched-chain amino acid transport system substrate-binding protein